MTQINTIRNERGDVTMTPKIQRIVKNCKKIFKKLYANKLDDLDEMNKFLETQSFKTESGRIRKYEQ